MENFEQWSDAQLLSAAQRYGEEARKWRNKFLGLLPEIDRRRLYEQQGFSSVFHFAKVLAGVSEEQVSRVLNVYRKLGATPVLQGLLTNGEVSVNKLARVASVATLENEEFLVSQVQILPQAAIETLVRDVRQAEVVRTHKPEQLQAITQVSVELSSELAERLQELTSRGFDVNELLMKLLDKRDQDIQQEKQTLGEVAQETDKRHIPQTVKNLLKKEYGIKCSMKGCAQPSEELHHTQRWSLTRSHDPRYMAPMCKEHHKIAHAIDLKVQQIKHQKKYEKPKLEKIGNAKVANST